MAQKFLDYAGLSKYDALIKSLIKSGDAELLTMINELREVVEGSDGESVDARIADVKDALEASIAALEAKHDSDDADAKAYTDAQIADAKAYADSLIEGVVDGAPEALNTLKEIASWIASDETGTAELISEVAANKADIAAANAAYELQEDRLSAVEEFIGVDGASDGESLSDRVVALEDLTHEEPGTISNAEIDALFVGESKDVVKNASSASAVAAISSTESKNVNLYVTNDEAANALTEEKTYKSVAIGGADIDTKLTVNAVESVAIDNVNVNGKGEDATGNGSINYAAKDMYVNDVNISGNTNYNVFEGTQDTSDNASHIENLVLTNVVCEDPSIKHNILNVYTPAEGAKISIKDSSFVLNADNSNVVRISNYLNSENVELTFENCDWNYASGAEKWAGFMLYQAAGADSAVSGDVSHVATWKIKFINCRYNGVKVTENVAGYSQALYTYGVNGNKAGVRGADAISSIGWEVSFE